MRTGSCFVGFMRFVAFVVRQAFRPDPVSLAL